jgi:hypothetical protein
MMTSAFAGKADIVLTVARTWRTAASNAKSKREQGRCARGCTMKIYGDALSGNCQKVRFLADHLGLPYTWVPLNTLKGESRTQEYLAKFPQGQVPAVELSNGRCLAQSNAIMRYLARGSPLLPDDAWTRPKSMSGYSGSSIATSHTSRSAAFTCSIKASQKRLAKRGALSVARRRLI